MDYAMTLLPRAFGTNRSAVKLRRRFCPVGARVSVPTTASRSAWPIALLNSKRLTGVGLHSEGQNLCKRRLGIGDPAKVGEPGGGPVDSRLPPSFLFGETETSSKLSSQRLLPSQDDIGRCSEQTVFSFERASFVIVIVTNFWPKNHRPPGLQGNARCESGVQTFEASPLTLNIVEELKPSCTAQTRREVVGQVVHEAEPRRRPSARHIGLESKKAVDGVGESVVDAMVVDQVEDLGVIECFGLVEMAWTKNEGKQYAIMPIGRSPLDTTKESWAGCWTEEHITAGHQPALSRPCIIEFERREQAGVREWIVNERVGSRGQGIERRVDTFDPKLSKEPADFYIQTLTNIWKICLSVKLNWVDPINVGLATVGGQLAVEQPACSRKAVIRTGQDRVKPEAEVCGRRFLIHRSLDSKPVLLKQKLICEVVETHRQLIDAICATRKRHLRPSVDLNLAGVEPSSCVRTLEELHEQPTIWN